MIQCLPETLDLHHANPRRLLRRGSFNSGAFEIVFYYGVNGSHAVFPIDFLAFRVSPAAVRNPYLINPAAPAGKFGNNFRLNTETIFFEMDRFDNRSFERFVACFHICQVEIGEDVREQS